MMLAVQTVKFVKVENVLIHYVLLMLHAELVMFAKKVDVEKPLVLI